MAPGEAGETVSVVDRILEELIAQGKPTDLEAVRQRERISPAQRQELIADGLGSLKRVDIFSADADDVVELCQPYIGQDKIAADLFRGAGLCPGTRISVQVKDALRVKELWPKAEPKPEPKAEEPAPPAPEADRG